ncbi:hypothetical protein BsIDN1_45000 [Bacillus safensis]|uniref:NOA1/YqeH-like C-terminal domain-containing protein n=2 Tax=Bacillus safensis TaxID=561879 RepID=A0A5S9ME55_BACIA|nr:hypothetical protein BsIDN1_45000 [Bacillus safensis]
MEDFPPLVPHTFTIDQPKMDIVFSGLGWVTANDAGKQVKVYAPKGVHVFMRRSLI